MSKHSKADREGSEDFPESGVFTYPEGLTVSTEYTQEQAEEMLKAIFGERPESGPVKGPLPDSIRVDEQIHIKAELADAVEVFFTDPREHNDAEEYLVLGFIKSGQEVMVMFTEKKWHAMKLVIETAIESRRAAQGSVFGEGI